MAAVTASVLLTKHSLPLKSSSASAALTPYRKISLHLNQKKKLSSISVSMSLSDLFGGIGGGAGVLERPKFDQSQFEPSTQLEEGGDIGRVRVRRGPQSGDGYRVLLIDDMRHSEDLVAKVLPQAVPAVTPDAARDLFLLSREIGLAVVIVAVKEHAEFYSEMMVRGGLQSRIEPDSAIL